MSAVMAVVAAIPWSVLWLLVGMLGAFVVVGAGKQQIAQFAIMAAFKTGRELIGAGLETVSDDDLARLAHAAYGALPSVVLVGPVPVPVGLLKTFLSEVAFVALVQKEYHAFRAAYQTALTARPPVGPGGLPTASPLKVAARRVQADATIKKAAAAKDASSAASSGATKGGA